MNIHVTVEEMLDNEIETSDLQMGEPTSRVSLNVDGIPRERAVEFEQRMKMFKAILEKND